MTPKINISKTKLIPINAFRTISLHEDKLIIRDCRNIHFIPKCDIRYCEYDSNYTHIHLKSGRKLIVSKCLKQIAFQLNHPKFKRIHSKYLINLDCLEKIEISNKKACLVGGQILPISRTKFKNLLETID